MKLFNGDGKQIHFSQEVIKSELLGPCSVVRSANDLIFITYKGSEGIVTIYPPEGKPIQYSFVDMDIAIIEFMNMTQFQSNNQNHGI